MDFAVLQSCGWQMYGLHPLTLTEKSKINISDDKFNQFPDHMLVPLYVTLFWQASDQSRSVLYVSVSSTLDQI